MERRTLNATMAAVLAQIALGGGGFTTMVYCSQRERDRKVEQPLFRDWNAQNQEVTIGTTCFIAELPFSKGSYFGGSDPAYFPFDAKIDVAALAVLRKVVSDVLPETSPLIIKATSPGAKYHTEHVMDPQTKQTTIAASFDHRIAGHVFESFRDRSLQNGAVQKEFSNHIEKELLRWMVYEVYVAFGISNRTKEDYATEGLLIQDAQIQALMITEEKVKRLHSPFRISADLTYNYRGHYQ